MNKIETELKWVRQILEHIERILNKTDMSYAEKIESIAWLMKQTQKREE
jgi:hypothetical protein